MSDVTRVLYNADCPVCSFEIDGYAAYARRVGLPIRFDDLNGPAREAWGIDAETAARRLHVLHAGEVLAGVPAFLALWRQMPRYRWLARLVGAPGMRQAASALYDHVLAPALFRWDRLRRRRAARRRRGRG